MTERLNAKVVIGAETAGARREIDKLKGAFGDLRTLILGALGIEGVRQIGQVVDGYANLSARLKLVTKDQAEFNTAQKELFALSQRNQAGLSEITTLYTRLAPAVKQLGGSQQQVLKITEAVALALRISGASAAESASAILQFSQAMGAGALRGEEFNALAEASPRLMAALADALGKPRGELKLLAEQGKLTADVVGNALIGQLDKLRTEVGGLPQTIGGAFTKLRNEFAKFLGESENVGAGARALTNLVNAVAENLGLLATAATVAGAAFAAIKFGQIVVAMATFVTVSTGLVATLGGIVAVLTGPVGLVAALGAAAVATIAWAKATDDLKSNSTKSLGEELQRLQKLLQDRAERNKGLTNDADKALDRRIEALKQEIELRRLADLDEQTRRREENRAAVLAGAGTPLRGSARAEPNKEFDKAIKALEEEAIKVQDISRAEEILREIQLGRYGQITEAQQRQLVRLAAIVDNNKALAEGEEKLLEVERDRNAEAERKRNADRALIGSLTGRTREAEQLNALRLLDAEYAAGRITLEEYRRGLDAIAGSTGRVEEKQDELRDALAGAGGNSLATLLDRLTTNARDLGGALRAAVVGFADEVRRFLISAIARQFVTYLKSLFSMGGGYGDTDSTGAKVFHGGGVAGAGGARRSGVSPFAFALAPRFHAGGITGLRSNEIPAILERGEEVLTRRDPRHSANGGGASGISVNVAVNGSEANAADQRSAGQDLARMVEGVVASWAIRQKRPGGILYGGA